MVFSVSEAPVTKQIFFMRWQLVAPGSWPSPLQEEVTFPFAVDKRKFLEFSLMKLT